VIAEIGFFFYQAPIFRRFGVRHLMLLSIGIAIARFLLIGFCAESLFWLLFAQILHSATFAAHHSSSVLTMQRWFAGPLQARGQALYISISYGLGGSFGGLLLSAFWSDTNGRAVYFAAAALAIIALIAAFLSFHWQRPAPTSAQ
jgi:PPP family 3-phenylpropionic acid transporter